MRRVAPAVLLLALLGAAGGGCQRHEDGRALPLEAVRITGDARMRTDTVGADAFAETATFVLVDAENTASDGAYVTLAGELTDEGGGIVGYLGAQSLWVPAGEVRTFALVDAEREARPTAVAARITVRGVRVPPDPPRARIEELHAFEDDGRIVVQAYLVNDAPRLGQAMVIGAFHDRDGRPMTRPFSMVAMGAQSRRTVRFVGPAGSTRGTIFVGDVLY